MKALLIDCVDYDTRLCQIQRTGGLSETVEVENALLIERVKGYGAANAVVKVGDVYFLALVE